jgi:predicted protein tyrosine phosphatase
VNLFISSLSEMHAFQGKATHILSVVDSDDVEHVLHLNVPKANRLILVCDDVESMVDARARERAMPGSRCIAPTATLVRRALAFARDLSENDVLLVHCGQGISRSTAIALAILCQANPDISEKQHFRKVLNLRPEACPNALILRHADTLLGRRGRIARAANPPKHNRSPDI